MSEGPKEETVDKNQKEAENPPTNQDTDKAKEILWQIMRRGVGLDYDTDDEDIIDINSNLSKKEKFIKGPTYITKNFPTLPKGLENVLLKELKLIKKQSFLTTF